MKQEQFAGKVLMADDDKDHAILFQRVLHQKFPGIRLDIVSDGEQLLNYLCSGNVDVLFLDLKMPCRNGFDCLKEIRNNPDHKDLPIIVYSGSAHMTDIQKAFVHKADLYMVKPFNSDHLITAFDSIFSFNWKDEVPIRNHYFINNSFVPYTVTG